MEGKKKNDTMSTSGGGERGGKKILHQGQALGATYQRGNKLEKLNRIKRLNTTVGLNGPAKK